MTKVGFIFVLKKIVFVIFFIAPGPGRPLGLSLVPLVQGSTLF